jgi:hypothetical protein
MAEVCVTVALALLMWAAWSASWSLHDRRVRQRYAESRLARFRSESVS